MDKLVGVSRGCGWQHLVAWTNLVAFYIIGLPLSLLLGFKLGFHTKVQTCLSEIQHRACLLCTNHRYKVQTTVLLTDHVQLPVSGVVDGSDMRSPLPECRSPVHHAPNKVGKIGTGDKQQRGRPYLLRIYKAR